MQRLYAHSSIYETCASKLLERIAELRTGNPLDEATVVGGLIDEAAAEKAVALVDDARSGWPRCPLRRHAGRHRGRPDPARRRPRGLRVCAEEAFAPIVVALAVRRCRRGDRAGERHAVGLQAGLFTNDLRIVHRAFERLEVGALIVNDVNTFRVDQMPYGGAKLSGHGREGMRWAIREMTEERLLVIDPR